MRGQIVRMRDGRAPGEIAGCGRQHHVRTRELTRHEAGGQFETSADGGIETFGDQVNRAVVEVPVRHDGRIAPDEVAQQRHDVLATKGVAHAHFQRAGGLAVRIGQIGHRTLYGGKTAADFAQEALARFGELQAARAALEQPHTQTRFQPRHPLADRRSGQTQPPRSF